MAAYLTPEEVAERLRLSPRTLSNRRAKGKGPNSIRIRGGRVRYPEADSPTGCGIKNSSREKGRTMPHAPLAPGAYPRRDTLVPIRGDDGLYRLVNVRHRTINGGYTRTSAQGRTIDECLEVFERRWKINRLEGSTVRRNSCRREKAKLQLTDKMSAAFKMFDEKQKNKAEKGKLEWYTYDIYHRTIFANGGSRARGDAIKLDVELAATPSVSWGGHPDCTAICSMSPIRRRRWRIDAAAGARRERAAPVRGGSRRRAEVAPRPRVRAPVRSDTAGYGDRSR